MGKRMTSVVWVHINKALDFGGVYHIAGNSGGRNFGKLLNFWRLVGFSMVNLWPCTIEDVHNGL